jgi:hypothetical protein
MHSLLVATSIASRLVAQAAGVKGTGQSIAGSGTTTHLPAEPLNLLHRFQARLG